jgi:hypothetical protein
MCPACISQATIAVATSAGGLAAFVVGKVVSKRPKARGSDSTRNRDGEGKSAK